MENDIFFFSRHGKYGSLSNFARYPVHIDGLDWPTTEHFYQAMKTRNLKGQEMIRSCATPGDAKFAGYHLKLREDWEDVKEEVMLKALKAKFTQHKNLSALLLSTGSAPLHEDSPWDKYWGYARGEGKDRLGVLLMQVRDELRMGEI